jgi:hypothetical protein
MTDPRSHAPAIAERESERERETASWVPPVGTLTRWAECAQRGGLAGLK